MLIGFMAEVLDTHVISRQNWTILKQFEWEGKGTDKFVWKCNDAWHMHGLV